MATTGPQPASQNGWGTWVGFMAVTSSVAGPVNKVLANVGVALQVQTGTSAQRLTHLGYRVDLAPDLPAGSVNSPTLWRLVVLDCDTAIPQDISQFQQQAFPSGAQPGIPSKLTPQASPRIIIDRWLNFANGDPGLNRVATIDLADSGPSVSPSRTMGILLTPILDANLPQTLLGAANALMYLEAWGTSIGAGAASLGAAQEDKSMPRWDLVPGARR